MKEYDLFVKYYDEIVRPKGYSLENEIEFIKSIIESNFTNKQIKILECACGTGLVMKELSNFYEIYGLDINQKMLNKAKKIIPEKKLFLGDMTIFDLDQKFDVILCNYNSICHLLSFEDWEKFFTQSYKHLNENGLLIFDINTVNEFEILAEGFTTSYQFSDDHIILKAGKNKTNYFWDIKIFTKLLDDTYKLTNERVSENTFEISKIQKSLSKQGFFIENIIDFHKDIVDEDSERVYFVAKN